MMEKVAKEETIKDNTKLFRKTVRDFNKETGLDFVLPKDTDYTSKYAHPVHDDGVIRITSQIDEDDTKLYALRLQIEGVEIDLWRNYSGDKTTKEQLDILLQSEAFKYRVSALVTLQELNRQLQDQINEVKNNLFEEAIKDVEREDIYDMTLRVARKLYKNKEG